MIDTSNLEEAKKLIRKEKGTIIVRAKSDLFNRKLVEQEKFHVLLSPETGEGKDNLRQEDSGLNEILARIMKNKNTSLGMDIDEIRKLPSLEKAARLSKIIQNIRICRKAGTNLVISGNKENFYLLLSLGASTEQAKHAAYTPWK